MITEYHAKYYANELKRKSPEKLENLSKSMLDAKVDLNPHQIDAALFAINSPFSKGAILADEVGLGKTIEAGLVLCQYWVERKRKILIITPSSLRKQWQNELLDKFNIDSMIMEKKSFDYERKYGNIEPFNQDRVIITSYNFAGRMKENIRLIDWDLVVIDEAHKLRNIYKNSSRTANNIKWALEEKKKLLLTATPIQNSLQELYGLSTLLDEYIFGDLKSFREDFIRNNNFEELKKRIKTFLHRTLRKDVAVYVNYTKRFPITKRFRASDLEQELYEKVSDFIMHPNSYSIPASQRILITLVIRKLLASSTSSIVQTFETIKERLLEMKKNSKKTYDIFNYLDEDLIAEIEEERDEFEEELGIENINSENKIDIKQLGFEIKSIEEIINLAKGVTVDTKGIELIKALEEGFAKLEEIGAKRKALIFTENKRTQEYLKKLLENNGYSKKIVLFNGSNSGSEFKEIYNTWIKEAKNPSESKTANMRMALVDYFKEEAEIMIATEAAAEGVNMQFCSMIVNYDLPWNPQRIEQRIGRCHRYGQKHDVIVINFLNERNLADIRVYELLNQKFNLFEGVLGSSDEILGSIESGMDFEKKIMQIYDTCRTENEIKNAFDNLQKEMEFTIKEKLNEVQQKIINTFDEDVQEKLKMRERETIRNIGKFEKLFWELSRYELKNYAVFDDKQCAFHLEKSPIKNIDLGTYRMISRKDGKDSKEQEFIIHRISNILGEYIIESAENRKTGKATIRFDITNYPTKISILENNKGKRGSLILSKLTINGIEKEEYLLFNGYLESENSLISLDEEFCEKLFRCDGEKVNKELFDLKEKLRADIKQNSLAKIHIYREKNDKELKEQEEKLYTWAEDLEKAKEAELEETKARIKRLQRDSRNATNTEEIEKINLELKELEKLKNRQRREIFAASDEIEEKRDELLEKLKNYKKYETQLEELFIIDFIIV